jgi:hypothetical protein
MARPKKHAEGLKKSVSFRLSEADFYVYEAKVLASGLKNSEFFRDCVLTNRTQIISKPSMSQDKKHLLYLFNKASNNLNQIAHRANSDYLAGKLTEKKYEEILHNLEQMTYFLKATLKNVD